MDDVLLFRGTSCFVLRAVGSALVTWSVAGDDQLRVLLRWGQVLGISDSRGWLVDHLDVVRLERKISRLRVGGGCWRGFRGAPWLLGVRRPVLLY